MPPFMACLTISAASTLDGIDGFTTSAPDSTATWGRRLPNARAKSTAFLRMSILAGTFGFTLTAPSVIISTRGLPGTVM